MIKNKFLLILSTIFVLSSCGNKENNPDDDPDKPIIDDSKITKVINKLNTIIEADSMTVNYVEKDSNDNDVSLKDIYTPEYALFGYSNEGYLLLDSYNKKLGDKLVYNFSYDSNGDIDVGRAVTYYNDNDELVGVNSVTDMNYLKLLKKGNSNFNNGEGLKVDDFKINLNEVYVEDEDLLSYMCEFMGYTYGDSETRISDVSFYIDDSDNINFNLYYQVDSDSSATSLLLTGNFSNLNDTKNDELADFVKDYKLPTKTINDTVKELLSNETIGFNTTLKYYSNNKWNEYGKTCVTSYIDKTDRNNDKIYYYLNDEINKEEYSYVLTKSEKDLNTGYIYGLDHYINGQNKEEIKPFEKDDFTWGNGIFSFQDEIDTESFLSDDGKTFLYYGFNTDRLFESYAALTVLTDIIIRQCFKITLSIVDNNIVINSYIDAYVASSTGEETDLKILATSTLNKDATISLPTSFKEETEDSKKVQDAINHLKEESWIANGYALSKDTGTESNELPKTNYYYEKDEYYIQDWANRTRGSLTGTVYSRQGYKQVEGGIIPFSITKASNNQGVSNPGDAKSKVTEIDKTHHLYDYFGINFDPKVFKKGDEENTYILKDNVKDISSFTMGNVHVDSLVDKSFKITLDSKGRLSKINYKYVYGGVYTGDEEIKFTYASDKTLSFPTNVVNKDSFDRLSTNLPSNWLEEEGLVKKKMVELYGEEVAKLIPYLTDASLSGSWNLTANYDGTDDYVIYNSKVTEEYIKKYQELLTKDGYKIEKVDNSTLGTLEYYTKAYEVSEEVTDETTLETKVVKYSIKVRIRFGSKEGAYSTLDNFYFGSEKTEIK